MLSTTICLFVSTNFWWLPDHVNSGCKNARSEQSTNPQPPPAAHITESIWNPFPWCTCRGSVASIHPLKNPNRNTRQGWGLTDANRNGHQDSPDKRGHPRWRPVYHYNSIWEGVLSWEGKKSFCLSCSLRVHISSASRIDCGKNYLPQEEIIMAAWTSKMMFIPYLSQ